MSDVARQSGGQVQRKLRHSIPREHKLSTDTRLQWLWNQRLFVVQSIMIRSTDILDRMAATLVVTATMTADLGAIELLLRRLEGGPVEDEKVVSGQSIVI